MISVARARAAIDAVIAACVAAGYTVAVAVVDDHGDLVAAQRMDGCRPRSMRMTQRKAYTAATMDRNTSAFHAELDATHREIGYYGDPRLCGLPGGVVVRDAAGNTIAAIGVTGNAKNRDEELAATGIPALLGER
jgi:glc operon protein GlcG